MEAIGSSIQPPMSTSRESSSSGMRVRWIQYQALVTVMIQQSHNFELHYL
jgi:hypothetical protein